MRSTFAHSPKGPGAIGSPILPCGRLARVVLAVERGEPLCGRRPFSCAALHFKLGDPRFDRSDVLTPARADRSHCLSRFALRRSAGSECGMMTLPLYEPASA